MANAAIKKIMIIIWNSWQRSHLSLNFDLDQTSDKFFTLSLIGVTQSGVNLISRVEITQQCRAMRKINKKCNAMVLSIMIDK